MQRLVTQRLFWQATVSGTNVAGPISSAIDLRNGIVSLIGIFMVASSVTSTPDMTLYWAPSVDGVTRSSFAIVSTLISSAWSINSGGLFVSLGSVPVMPFLFFGVSGTNGNPADTRVIADLVMRQG